ncbi:MAG: hypothetical protein IPN71_22810 [Fibrobacteres bacterium]|nr:hypothetical protein [Fibrobacterota bacterium]
MGTDGLGLLPELAERWRIEAMLDPSVRRNDGVARRGFDLCSVSQGWFRVRHGADRNLLIDTLLRLDSLGQVSFEFTPRGVDPEFLTLLAASDGKMPWSIHNISFGNGEFKCPGHVVLGHDRFHSCGKPGRILVGGHRGWRTGWSRVSIPGGFVEFLLGES